MTHLITTQFGKIVEGRDALAAAFRALPDGEHLVRISPRGDIISAISDVVEWYGALSESEQNDPNLLGVLVEKARLLSTLCFSLAIEVTHAKEQAAAEENALEAQRTVLMHNDRKAAIESGAKYNATASAVKADFELLALSESAGVSASMAHTLAEHLRAAKEVLRVISSNHIPMLRAERQSS